MKILLGFTLAAGIFAMLLAPDFTGSPVRSLPPPLSRYEFTQPHMGIEFKLLLYAPDVPSANQAAAAAFARIALLDAALSDYNPDSELSRLSATAGSGQSVRISDELWNVLAAADGVSRRSSGAFDVTVGPVVKLWRRARGAKEMPNAELLAEARSAVGYEFLKRNKKRQTAMLLRPRMRLDLGGIAKGYAADQALRVLREQGCPRALVAAAGDIALGDPPPDEEGWLVGVASLSPDDPPQRELRLAHCAISTSGDARQYVEIDGARYSHIVDPRTGLGLTRRSSVTVVAPRGMSADALASAVSVLGPEQGLKLIDSIPDTAAVCTELVNGEVKVFDSKRMSGIAERY